MDTRPIASDPHNVPGVGYCKIPNTAVPASAEPGFTPASMLRRCKTVPLSRIRTQTSSLLYTYCADLSTGSLPGNRRDGKFVQSGEELRVGKIKFGGFSIRSRRRRLRNQTQETHGAASAQQSEEKP